MIGNRGVYVIRRVLNSEDAPVGGVVYLAFSGAVGRFLQVYSRAIVSHSRSVFFFFFSSG